MTLVHIQLEARNRRRLMRAGIYNCGFESRDFIRRCAF
jgi:hypothetical protein